MSGGGWMTGQGLCIAHIHHALEQAERIETLCAGFKAALYAERQ